MMMRLSFVALLYAGTLAVVAHAGAWDAKIEKLFEKTEKHSLSGVWPKASIDKETLSDKPVMVLVTQPWCGACNNLKTQINADTSSFTKLMKKFNVIHVEGDNDPAKWQENGHGYVPQTYFYSKLGAPYKTVKGPNSEYAHFFPSAEPLTAAMNAVLGHEKSAVAAREELTKFYEANNPEKLDGLDNLMAKWTGKEKKMVKAVKDKYAKGGEQKGEEL